tara:strand:+ start:1754 stop:2485 length:732 start_codon:yes stop_codon:yes gene_type:complete
MMKLPPLEYTFDNVVLGWREEAVSFAREHGYHLIVNSDQRPFHHFIGHQDIKSKWYEGIFDLGMRSLLPIPFDVQTIGLNEEGRLKVVTEGNTKVLINFKKLHIFDLDNCGNLGVDEVIKDYLVHDMFDITAGSRLSRDIVLKPRDTFVRLVEFITSNRIDRNTSGDFKDIVVTSVIPREDIRSFDCSETVIRILLERKLKEHEIKQPNGRSLKIRHSSRHTVKNSFHFKPVDELDTRIVLHE